MSTRPPAISPVQERTAGAVFNRLKESRCVDSFCRLLYCLDKTGRTVTLRTVLRRFLHRGAKLDVTSHHRKIRGKTEIWTSLRPISFGRCGTGCRRKPAFFCLFFCVKIHKAAQDEYAPQAESCDRTGSPDPVQHPAGTLDESIVPKAH